MKTYKHKKTGETATYKDGVLKSSGFCVEIGVEPSSEYWEEIVEKDYEILEITFEDGKPCPYKLFGGCYDSKEHFIECFLNASSCNYKIHSVKRLSDSKVFSVNNEIAYKNKIYTIEIIYLLEDGVRFYVGQGLNFGIKNISVFQRPLFKSDDGKQIFEGDEVIYKVTDFFDVLADYCVKSEALNYIKGRTFSTKKAAENYIKMNKPCLTYKEILNLYDEYAPTIPMMSSFRDGFKTALTKIVKQKLK